MSSFTFKKEKDPENHYDVTDLTMSVGTEDLYDVLDAFEKFLRGAGFIINGRIDLVDDELEQLEAARNEEYFNFKDALEMITESDNAQTRDSLQGMAQAALYQVKEEC